MITNPEQMPEFKKLENRIRRLYGMGSITIDQHLTALELLDAVKASLSMPIDVMVDPQAILEVVTE